MASKSLAKLSPGYKGHGIWTHISVTYESQQFVKLLSVSNIRGMLKEHQLTSAELLLELACVGEGADTKGGWLPSHLISGCVAEIYSEDLKEVFESLCLL